MSRYPLLQYNSLKGSPVALRANIWSSNQTMEFKVHPLTPDCWPALESLFDGRWPVSRCWCMYWRIGNEYRKRPGDINRQALHEIVLKGPSPGLLAFCNDTPVGWCQVTPRNALPWLDRTWRLKRIDDLPVWSLSCFFVRKDLRRSGVASSLISSALEVARLGGAPALEAYPLDAKLTPSASHTGFLSTYLRNGFKIVARHVLPRPIVRYYFMETD